MLNVKNDILKKLTCLLDMYEEYVSKHFGCNIDILMQDGSISYYLYNDKDSVDEFVLTFSGEENNLYNYLSVNLLSYMMKDMIVFNEDNEFSNNNVKPYLKMTVNDRGLANVMNELVMFQFYGLNNRGDELLDNLGNKVPFSFVYPYGFMKKLDKRMDVSKKLLKNGDNR